MKTINICQFSNILTAYLNCCDKGKMNLEWMEKHQDTLNEMIDLLPHGSGIDNGIKFDWEKSNGQKLIFTFGFHHMDENGYYDGWTDHVLTITPSFPFGYDMKISGKDRNGIKEYLYSLLHDCFTFDPLYQLNKVTA